ncbi:MAG: SMP-30/gluconolactonase/LRE family protein [Steroidobacteraceae bacterium]
MDFETVCGGLRFPEGPVWMLDGSVIVVEIEAGRITRIRPDGGRETAATPGGGPNGGAIGPDGALYVTNNGGLVCTETDGILFTDGSAIPGYQTGSIERVDLRTGAVERLYDTVDGRQLWGPNDIVFDTSGGFWFTDLGKRFEHHRRDGGIFYALPDGSSIRRVVDHVQVNGIALSPDGKRLYASVTDERLLLEFDVVGPGELAASPVPGRVAASFPGRQMLDSMAVTADGHVCVGALFENPGIAEVDPMSGKYSIHPFPDIYTTNICFGGKDMRDAWITLSTTGRLVKARWSRPGLRLAFYA